MFLCQKDHVELNFCQDNLVIDLDDVILEIMKEAFGAWFLGEGFVLKKCKRKLLGRALGKRLETQGRFEYSEMEDC